MWLLKLSQNQRGVNSGDPGQVGQPTYELGNGPREKKSVCCGFTGRSGVGLQILNYNPDPPASPYRSSPCGLQVTMTTAISIEDVRREVKILRALIGHENLVQFYEAYEDEDNVCVVMEKVWTLNYLDLNNRWQVLRRRC